MAFNVVTNYGIPASKVCFVNATRSRPPFSGQIYVFILQTLKIEWKWHQHFRLSMVEPSLKRNCLSVPAMQRKTERQVWWLSCISVSADAVLHARAIQVPINDQPVGFEPFIWAR